MNIYISGLSYGTNDADLTNLFAEFGEVSSAKVIFDRETLPLLSWIRLSIFIFLLRS